MAPKPQPGTAQRSAPSLNWIELLEEPERVVPPPGIVYSTNPLHARATDGHTYILKGPDTKVVFAEATCYQLAELLGLSVPRYGLCKVPVKGVFLASQEVRTRSAVDELLRVGKVLNPELLPQAVAFDVWVANEDRNLGNVVGEPSASNGTGSVKLYAIDFEKAAVLNGVDRFTVTALAASKFWPAGTLGGLCEKAAMPTAFCARIGAMTRTGIDGVLHRSVWDLDMPEVPWLDTAVDVLVQRASKIASLVGEVWND